ncbi:11644_t:CDS:2, partial [Ambispora leptoticha]
GPSQPNLDITQQKNLVDTEMTTPIIKLENTQTDNKIETDTASTISAQQESSNTRSYSQVTKQNLINNTMQIDEDPTQKWLEHIYKELTKEITQPFDDNTWHYDKLITDQKAPLKPSKYYINILQSKLYQTPF